MKKLLILIASPPACGKTRLAKKLSLALGNAVYLDKDALIPLSKRVFAVAKKPYNRSSAFFNRNIRDYEYEVILNLGYEAMRYGDTVIINAPFTREVRDKEYIEGLASRAEDCGGELLVVWINADEETCYKRMKKRNSDRDKWKLSHWNEYVKTIDFSSPESAVGKRLFEYDNCDDKKAEECFSRLLQRIENLRK